MPCGLMAGRFLNLTHSNMATLFVVSERSGVLID